MTSTRRLFAIITPISILICYGLIRFANVPPYSRSRIMSVYQHSNNSADFIHPAIMEKRILTSEIYQKGFDVFHEEICPNLGKNMNLLIIVTTKMHHKTKRMAIRNTWGHYALRNDISVAFLMGRRSNNISTSEMSLYSDLIFGKNIYHAYNRTLQSISMMEFVSKHCPQVQYILKVKDDVFINIPPLLKLMHNLNATSKNFYGQLHHNMKISKSRRSKFYISNKVYKNDTLPDFLATSSYLFPAHIANDVYVESLNQLYIPIEEVFITGFVAEKIGIKPVDKNEFDLQYKSHELNNHYSYIFYKCKNLAAQYEYWIKINNPTY